MNWPLAPLSPSLAKVVRGVTFSQADASSAPFDSGVPVLRAGNIQDRLITEADLVWVDQKFVSKEQYLQRNDIVLCTSSGSASLVGKSAILEQEFEGTWGAFNAVIRCNPDVLMPHYMAFWLSSAAFRSWKNRQIQGANIQNIKQSSLESIRPPIPTVIEQQRIVDVLRQAEATSNQKSRSQLLDLMIKSALDHLVLARPESEWEALGTLVETRYGTSVSADATAETGVAVLRIPNVMGGEVDVEDLKYVELSQAELKRLGLTTADVLIVRSNGNPDYVGRSAPITGDVAKSAMVYASYLIRLRAETTRLLPEYLSAFLNSAYGRAAMRNAIRTTAGQSNLSGENLTKLRLPVPPIAEQERFRDFWLQVRELRRLIAKSENIANDLRDALSVQALSGELTIAWRDAHAAEIVNAAQARDAVLRQRGAKLAGARATNSAQISAPAHSERSTGFSRPRRQALIDQLSSFQHEVWNMLRYEWRGAVLADDPVVFEDFCTNPQTAWRLDGLEAPPVNVRRALEQLAAMGLIRRFSLPQDDHTNDTTLYLTAFRPLREDRNGRRAEEDLALVDVATVRAELKRRDRGGE